MEKQKIIYCFRNERRLTAKQISEETCIKIYKIRKYLKTLFENEVIEREPITINSSMFWIYKLKLLKENIGK